MRVPNFYCPNCDRFKKWFQVERVVFVDVNSEIYYCRHCGNRLIETEELFLNIVKQACAKKDGKENEDGRTDTD